MICSEFDNAGEGKECPQIAALPPENGPFRPHDLVEVIRLEPGLRVDVRYATANNFVGRPVYSEGRVFLQRPAAEALVRVHEHLRGEGYGLLIFDGYRPWSVTRLFWAVVSEEQRRFVADPAEGSRHNRGCAVDLTLCDVATGREIVMPCPYDEMTERAYPDYAGGCTDARRQRDRLRQAMESEGFSVYPTEWWHFDYRDWRKYALLDLPFAALDPG